MGLVQYDSSDEDDEVQSPPPQTYSATPATAPTQASKVASEPLPPTAAVPSSTATTEINPPTTTSPPPGPAPAPTAAPAPGPSPGPAPSQSTTNLRPVPLGPARPPPSASTPSPVGGAEPQEEVDLSFLNPSPTTTNDPPNPQSRAALLRDLTLPAVPNLDIPPSPPSSPRTASASEALTARVSSLLKAKRTNNVHFNTRLAGSKGMRDPGVTDKLLRFSGIETDFSSSSAAAAAEDERGEAGGGDPAIAQYQTVLPASVYNPSGFPAWAYRPALRRAQDRAAKERERGKGERVEFVSAGTTAVGGSNG
ncbi:hypothetical protein VTJ49DRAFT_7700 [Mycothermus thermophilus]|uniref:Uncharacterized protein n=1 Tax=Humicola insolens TaxID=85995 RepID=A0ABR3VGD9_HUMIN